MKLRDWLPESIKEQIPRPVKDAYKSFYSPESDTLFSLRYRHKQRHTIDCRGLTLLFDTSTLTAKRWFFPRYPDGSPHEPIVSKKLLNVLDGDSVFFDVGANVGFYSVLASRRCRSVHSFELDPRLASIVSSHFELSQTQNARVICAAISDSSEGVVSFTPHQTGNLSTNTIDEGHAQGDQDFEVSSLTLDRYCSEVGVVPDVAKVDVEGFEGHVLDGFERTLTESPPRALFVEIHPEILDGFNRTPQTLLSELRRLGYACYRFEDHRSQRPPEESLSRITDATSFTTNCMLFCTR